MSDEHISAEHVAFIVIPIALLVAWYMIIYCPIAYYLLFVEIALLDLLKGNRERI